jgi:hypothetical protein
MPSEVRDTPAFDNDYRRPNASTAATFKGVVKERFAPACDAKRQGPPSPWPASAAGQPSAVRSGIREKPGPSPSRRRATFDLHRNGELHCFGVGWESRRLFKNP